MKKIAIAMLSAALIGTPALAASTNNQQQPQGAQAQPQNNKQPQSNNQPNNTQSQNSRQSAENNQTASPQNLPRSEIRQVQQALDKNGFKAGTPDGRWGQRTEDAVKQFQQSKQIQANGQLDQQTVADLGLDASRFNQQQRNQK